MQANSIVVRQARPEDGEQIFPWTQNTFSWGDYIPRVWHNWLDAPDGNLLVAELDGRIVGNLHVAFLGNRESWMEGMRVHPDYRQRGVATALDLAGQQAARAAKCRVVRLETASNNLPAQAAIVTYGYRRVLQHVEYEAPAREEEPSRTRAATLRDLARLYELWCGSAMFRATHGLVLLPQGWRWAEMTRPRLREQIEKGWVAVTPTKGQPLGFSILRREGEEMEISLLVGRAAQARDLLEDMRALAAKDGVKSMWLALPPSARGNAVAEASGFKRQEHSMLLYECRLDRQNASRPRRT